MGSQGGGGATRLASFATALIAGMVILSAVGTGTAAGVSPASATEIDTCTTITSSGTYLLNTSLIDVGPSSCIEIETSDVYLDGGGNTVDGTNATGSIGINVSSSTTTLTNVTVTNVTVTGWEYGVGYNGTKGGNVTELNASENAGVGLNFTSAEDVAVDNVTATGNGDTAGSGVVVGASPNASVVSVTANGNADDGVDLAPGARNATVLNVTANDNGNRGIDVRTTNSTVAASVANDNGANGTRVSGTNNTIQNTTVRRNGDNGIFVGANDTAVLANDAINNTGDGIRIAGSNTVVSDNRANDNGAVGILGEEGTENNSINKNTANGNANNGIQVGDRFVTNPVSNNSVLGNNTANDNGASGIGIFKERTVAVDNVAKRNAEYGFYLDDADKAKVQGGEARNNDGSGIWVAISDDVVIEDIVATNNTVNTHASGIYIRGGTGLAIGNVTLRNNVHAIGTGFSDTKNVSLVNATISGSSVAAIDGDHVVNLTATNVRFAQFTADFEATHATLDPLDPANTPEPPAKTDDVGVLADVTMGFSPAYLVFEPQYEESDTRSVEESTIRMWQYHNGWNELNSSVNTSTNRVGANVTSSGKVAPLGSTLANFSSAINSTTEPVTAGETLTVQTTVTNDGGTTGTQTVALEVDGATVDSESVSLDPDASTTLTLRWETGGGDVGAHSVAVSTANGTVSRSVDVRAADSGGGGGAQSQQDQQDQQEAEQAETVAQATEEDAQESADGESATVSVSGTVPADEPARFDTQTDTTADNSVAVDDVTITADRARSVSMSVTQSTDPPSGSPSFTNPRGTDARGHVSIQHDIPNDQVREAAITFRVRKDRLGPDEDPSDVALYRNQQGTWNELPTTQVDETATHHVFRADSPGLSDFTVGVKQARFEIADALVSVTELNPGEGTEVQVRVTNTGGADGSFEVALLLDGDPVERRTLTVAANGTRRTVFDRSFSEPGEYGLSVNNVSVGTITVQPANATGGGAGPGAAGTGTPTPTSTGFIPGFGPLHALVALLLATLVLARRRG